MGRASRSKAARHQSSKNPASQKTERTGLPWSRKIQLGLAALLLGTVSMLLVNMMAEPDALARAENLNAGQNDAAEQTPESNEPRRRPERRPGTEANAGPPIRIDPPRLTFSNMEPNETRTGRAMIHNEGSEPLRIRHSSASCGCTAVDMAGTTILPGSSEPLEIEFTSNESPSRSSQVTLIFTGYESPVRYTITGNLAPQFVQ